MPLAGLVAPDVEAPGNEFENSPGRDEREDDKKLDEG
jgi:hypothetical protein